MSMAQPEADENIQYADSDDQDDYDGMDLESNDSQDDDNTNAILASDIAQLRKVNEAYSHESFTSRIPDLNCKVSSGLLQTNS